MENASKALIVAGAILIAILLITIGIIIINSINNPTNQAEDEGKVMSAQMYNAKFTQYAGTQTTKEIRELISLVDRANASQTHNHVEICIRNISKGQTGWYKYPSKSLQKKLIENENYKVELGGFAPHVNVGGDAPGKISKGGYVEFIGIIGNFK